MVEERDLAGICQRIRGSARVPKSQNLSRIEGSTASLSRKYKSAARRRSIADRSGQRCFALPGWSARFGKRRTLCASRCLQNSVRIAKSFWRINAIRRPRAFSIHEFSAQFNGRFAPASGQSRQRRIIFFGTPFLLVKNLEPAVYVEHLNRCLDYIRQNYPGRDLIYRPHPFEKGEASKLNLEGFKV